MKFSCYSINPSTDEMWAIHKAGCHDTFNKTKMRYMQHMFDVEGTLQDAIDAILGDPNNESDPAGMGWDVSAIKIFNCARGVTGNKMTWRKVLSQENTEYNSKMFDIGTILSITHCALLTDMDNIYKILDYMLEEELYTHQLLRATDFCKPFILQQHPELEKWDIYSEKVNSKNWQKMLAKAQSMFGNQLEIQKVPSGVWTHKDPKEELENMMGKDNIIELNLSDEKHEKPDLDSFISLNSLKLSGFPWPYYILKDGYLYDETEPTIPAFNNQPRFQSVEEAEAWLVANNERGNVKISSQSKLALRKKAYSESWVEHEEDIDIKGEALATIFQKAMNEFFPGGLDADNGYQKAVFSAAAEIVNNVTWNEGVEQRPQASLKLSWEESEAICSACQGKGCIHCNQTGKVEKDSVWAKPSTIPKETSKVL
jgi:hypothetical protein